MRNILIFADLTSPLMFPRIKMLESLPYNKYILHNANNSALSSDILEKYKNFIVLEHPKINNVKLRYFYSFFYTLFLLLRLSPKLIVVHWASRLYQNLLLALWGKRVIVHTMGGEINEEEDCYGKKKFFTGVLFGSARIITGKTEIMKEILLKNFSFVSKEKIKIISWGVEKRFFEIIAQDRKRQLQKEMFGREFQFLFFSIRAFRPYHFHKEILQNFIAKYGRNTQIGILVSTQECNREYLEMCKRDICIESYPNIFFATIPHDKMHSVMNMVDCVISYKKCDGISQSLMEAVASNKWIIANEIPNHSMLLKHKENAFLVRSIDELKEAFAYVQSHLVKKSENQILKKEQQEREYLKILKEFFDV